MRRLLLAGAAMSALATATPAYAVGGIATYMTYTSAGTFTCHAIAASGPTTNKLGSSTMVSCSVNGVREIESTSNGWHAHGAGATTLEVGSTARFCVDASTVYGLFPPLFSEYDNCKDVVVQAGGGAFQL